MQYESLPHLVSKAGNLDHIVTSFNQAFQVFHIDDCQETCPL